MTLTIFFLFKNYFDCIWQ